MRLSKTSPKVGKLRRYRHEPYDKEFYHEQGVTGIGSDSTIAG